MIHKTICIPEEDVSLFEEAERLGCASLSSVVAQALRRFVDVKRAELYGMQEHVLHVGVLRSQGADDTHRVCFIGRLLAEEEVFTGQLSDHRDRGTVYRVYQTKAGKILVWWSNWTRWERETQVMDYAVMAALPDYNEEVVGKVHGFPEILPGELLQDAAEALPEQELADLVEFID